jgi:large subunit ribosomal protein L24
MHIRVNDTVEMIAGDEVGTRGRVLRILRSQGKVVVEGVNRVAKHIHRSQRNPQGGRLSKEMAVDLSNVALVCNACGKPTRTGARYLADGSKERYCKKCGAGNGQLAAPKKRYANK